MKPQLRFKKSEIGHLASRYEYQLSDAELVKLKPIVISRGHLTKNELEKIAKWKAPRSSGHTRNNDKDYVTEITRFAFASNHERVRIESLKLLDGVSWSTATVILHFFHSDPYPILDFRAIWSLSLEQPSQYTFNFWWTYVEFCRKLAKGARVDMRTLDKALWQYSKENQ